MVMPMPIMLHGGGNLSLGRAVIALIVILWMAEKLWVVIDLIFSGYEKNQKRLFWLDVLIPFYLIVRKIINSYQTSFPKPEVEKKTSYKDYIK
jgi:hypothetical protein